MATGKLTAMLLQNVDENKNTELIGCVRYIFASLFLGLGKIFLVSL